MGTGQVWILLTILQVISALPRIPDVSMGLEDVALEMVLCGELEGACRSQSQESLEPVVMKLERAVEAKELVYGENLEATFETRVGRLLCALDYNNFCSSEVRGRGRAIGIGSLDMQAKTPLCAWNGINCKAKGRMMDSD